ncbi:hypothetical protein ABZV75_40110, partial [Streptomyces flaveolus]|uniref:hypothetical protein n=1 Tax=Streptomyces flaveolus TaxID=67297 RepID=UPI00339FD907
MPAHELVSYEAQVRETATRLEGLARDVGMPGEARAAHVRGIREAAGAGDWSRAADAIAGFRDAVESRDLSGRYASFGAHVGNGFDRLAELGVPRAEWQRSADAVRGAWERGDVRALDEALRDYTALIERHVPVEVLTGRDVPVHHDPELGQSRRETERALGPDADRAHVDFLRAQDLSRYLRARLDQAAADGQGVQEAVLRQRLRTASTPEEESAAARDLDELLREQNLQERRRRLTSDDDSD